VPTAGLKEEKHIPEYLGGLKLGGGDIEIMRLLNQATNSGKLVWQPPAQQPPPGFAEQHLAPGWTRP